MVEPPLLAELLVFWWQADLNNQQITQFNCRSWTGNCSELLLASGIAWIFIMPFACHSRSPTRGTLWASWSQLGDDPHSQWLMSALLYPVRQFTAERYKIESKLTRLANRCWHCAKLANMSICRFSNMMKHKIDSWKVSTIYGESKKVSSIFHGNSCDIPV